MMSKQNNIPKLRFKEFEREWEVYKINKLTNVTSGGTPSTLKKEYWNGNIPWMNSGELNLKLVYDVENRITELGLNKSSTKFIPKKSILIGLAGQGKTRGTAAMNMIELCINQSIGAILPNKEKFISEFLYINIDSRYDELRKLSTGDGGRGGLNLQIIKSLNVSIPSLPEQQKIASFLSTVDEKIQQLSRKKELLEQYKKGIMQQLFSGTLRFKDENGDDYADWEDKVLGDILKRTSTGLNPITNFILGSGKNYYVTIKNISNGTLDFKSCEKIDDEAMKLIKKRSDLSKNDIIMSSIGNIGEAYLLDKDPIDWNINESVFMLRASEYVLPKYLYYIITNDISKWYFESNSTGSSFKSIKLAALKLLPIKLPSLHEQQKIAAFLSSIDSKIESTNLQINQTQSFKKGLLQKMFV